MGYEELNIDGDRLVLTEKTVKSGTIFYIGDRFFYRIKTYDAEMAFDFFRNYAVMLKLEELKKGWDCYKKAVAQKAYSSTITAFWNYFEGKKIKRLDRYGHVTQWVKDA